MPSCISIKAMPSVRQISWKALPSEKSAARRSLVGGHRIRADGVQRDHDVIAALSEIADPVFRGTGSGIADEFGALGGAGDECAEGLERESWARVALISRATQSGPGDSDV